MNICIISAFRNMSGRIHRYMAQVRELQNHARRDNQNHRIRVVAVTGDNTDDTERELLSLAGMFDIADIKIVNYDTHKPLYPSIEHKERLEALTGVMKAGMGAVAPAPRRGETVSYHPGVNLAGIKFDDVVLCVESDLLWEPHQVGSIIDMAYRREQGFDIIAPMVFAGDMFYDVFVFRKDGARFSPHPPYTHGMKLGAHEITEVDSVGSCLAFRAELARTIKPIGDECLISWCNGARAQGYRVGVAQGFKVSHP
jgi:hypothetical protein